MDPLTIVGIIVAAASNAGPIADDIKSLANILGKQLRGEAIPQAELDFLEQQRVASQSAMDAAANTAIADAKA